uniref:Uncharacterized protein n=1 Tax=Lepeophtheirus salmonis TaxID=72036 RepID=A0A0K2U1X1_LEPSM
MKEKYSSINQKFLNLGGGEATAHPLETSLLINIQKYVYKLQILNYFSSTFFKMLLFFTLRQIMIYISKMRNLLDFQRKGKFFVFIIFCTFCIFCHSLNDTGLVKTFFEPQNMYLQTIFDVFLISFKPKIMWILYRKKYFLKHSEGHKNIILGF